MNRLLQSDVLLCNQTYYCAIGCVIVQSDILLCNRLCYYAIGYVIVQSDMSNGGSMLYSVTLLSYSMQLLYSVTLFSLWVTLFPGNAWIWILFMNMNMNTISITYFKYEYDCFQLFEIRIRLFYIIHIHE